VRRSAVSLVSLGATLTPGDIAIEKDLSGPLVNRLPFDADHGVIQIALDGYKDADNRQRHDDHQQVDPEPLGYALRGSLGHACAFRDPYFCAEERKWL
jgi:hypothetical protein